jgi:hypothetical protein
MTAFGSEPTSVGQWAWERMDLQENPLTLRYGHL